MPAKLFHEVHGVDANNLRHEAADQCFVELAQDRWNAIEFVLRQGVHVDDLKGT